MVHLSVPGMTLVEAPIEIVQRSLSSTAWAEAALASLDRFHAVVVGPGLGRSRGAKECGNVSLICLSKAGSLLRGFNPW